MSEDIEQFDFDAEDGDLEARVHDFTVKPAHGRRRLDVHLASHFPEHSRTFFKRLILEGAVEVNGARVRPSFTPQPGDHVAARIPVVFTERVKPENIPLDILYEDDWIIVLNKPADMVVHPARGHHSGTLVNAVAWHCKQLSRKGGELRAGIVHRLDRDTTGVIMMVKDELVHEQVARQFEQREVEKLYVAVCEGEPALDSDLIDVPIGPHPRQVERMAVRYDVGRSARTIYKVLERLGAFGVVQCRIETGRTHQIRVHMQHIGHPLVCDPVYGRRESIRLSELTGGRPASDEPPLLARQALHARRLRMRHPVLESEMTFEAPVPPDMSALVEALRRLKGARQEKQSQGR